jgi:hypothetical protein
MTLVSNSKSLNRFFLQKRGLENSLSDARHWHDIELQNLGSVVGKLEAELSSMRGRSLREVQSLKEHLRLALAALQEGQVLGNSLEH